ncbi:helix-turn-helix domain-containing protein [Parapedobacter koreensis]|uniref:Transcriptional regulator, contains XRE-family HTH domain n=1 Tax=Parapedobacter koreensis TaxID=332977 RepID=A0A1H7P1E2_9SPHI|nr:helix-turn-helix transcriptional regulator [Parapedobacter koreensis]SEL29622.1 Transcriptional regulator, contains XRE-family HTH domain [Parapedobacter koreensis]
MMYFSKNIKFLREERKLGQHDLAKLLNVSRDNVASYERGSIPKLDVLVRIVNLFHIDLSDLVEKDLEITPPSSYAVATDSSEVYQRVDQSEDLTLESLQKLVKIQEKYIKTLEEKIEADSKTKR